MKIFIVDDDRSIRQTLRDVLEDEDFEVEDFATGRAMVKALGRERPALILLDVWMGKEDGLDILDRIKEVYPTLPVLMISGHGTIEQAVQATKKGAVDFLEKPLSLDTVLERISQALKLEDRKNGKVPEPIRLEFDEIIGNSEQILQVKRSISQAAQTNARVFIYGENGTGKELVARAIYQNSKRRDQPFIEVNCAAIPEELIESELFGHEKGAFTGATEQHIGKFEQAHGGTLFLDEICDMSLATQARVLRVLQEQRFMRVGGKESIEVDVRIIAATNIPPEEAIAEGRFREDLYYRLNVVPINMPALRERKGDIPLMLDYFLVETAQENQIRLKQFTNQAVELLVSYTWPGNVRELKNVVERLCIMTDGTEITPETVAEHLRDTRNRPRLDGILVTGDLKKAREDFERNYIIQALRQNEKNISRAARFLGIERTNLHRKLKSLGIDPESI
ncbi:MAG: sigma-54-dependent Fis family transcriptional regulator [Leptospiraceae bacterium]|nr:sigma-54-dependent Fis family transcriptional regulator [Leptospiraceae bacterium]